MVDTHSQRLMRGRGKVLLQQNDSYVGHIIILYIYYCDAFGGSHVFDVFSQSTLINMKRYEPLTQSHCTIKIKLIIKGLFRVVVSF